MNKEMKKVPDVRFKGFTDDWEQHKLGDCFEERRENMPDGELLSVTINDGIKKFSELGRHDNSNDDKSKYKRVCIGDIAYNSMRMWQGASGYSIYEGIVSPAYTVLKSKSDINSRFASYLFKCQEMMHTFQVNSQGITSDNWNLKFPALSQIKVKLPCQIYEQKKVADYLNNIDGFVVLHQRKLDQLQTLKKYCLQNMFPAKEGKVPAIRFKGFTDDWKQHKLGKLLAFRNGFNGNLQQYGSGIPLISVMDILNNSFIFSDTVQTKANLNETEIKRYIVHYGDVLFQRSSETVEDAGSSNVYLDSQNIAVFGGFVICGRKIGDYDPVFFRYLLDSNKIRHQIVIRAQGVQHINVSQDTLEDVSIDLPSKSEQKMIGVCLCNLDNFITLQQHKLDQLQSLKKFMLQNLFIQRK